jgi:hypothetical protein
LLFAKNQADFRNPCAFQKIRRIYRILALSKKSGGFTESLRLQKIRRIYRTLRFSKDQADLQNPGVLQKNRLTIESLRALKSPRLVKNQRDWKSWRPAYCSCSAEYPAADILLEWLKSLVQILVDVLSLSCSPQVRRRLRLPCFYRWTLSRTKFTRKSKN